jgi:hypothetical protein
MRIFYGSENGKIEESAIVSFRDLTDLFGKLLPEKVMLEDTKQVVFRGESVFGEHLSEAYYTFRGYSVWKR